MDIKRLMIGDWVYLHDTPCQVSWLADDDDECDKNVSFYGLSAAQNDSWVHPIPLTEDILKANGFEFVDKPNPLAFRYRRIDIDNRKEAEITIHNSKKLYILHWECFKMPSLNVHELQHCLRICHLDEWADNFKLK